MDGIILLSWRGNGKQRTANILTPNNQQIDEMTCQQYTRGIQQHLNTILY